ncbi:DUF4258 domain-containing protein [Thioalkalicoccus limnaeus]|uniref:DUF4258 domain-containing protein n=1 Tax=Thioalkalicoccus limnaeus TaxID=120681 RepID=A0ABV4BC84_9GAMM
MDFILTDHARKRCARRGIQERRIREALENPATIEQDIHDSDLAHALWPVPEKGFRILRAIYNETVHPVAVVTAFFEAKAKTP